jgi:hypothetical protein
MFVFAIRQPLGPNAHPFESTGFQIESLRVAPITISQLPTYCEPTLLATWSEAPFAIAGSELRFLVHVLNPEISFALFAITHPHGTYVADLQIDLSFLSNEIDTGAANERLGVGLFNDRGDGTNNSNRDFCYQLQPGGTGKPQPASCSRGRRVQAIQRLDYTENPI